MPTSYSRSAPAAGEPWRKVLQQLAEELRAEYMEGKGAVAVGTRWAAMEATTAAAAAAAAAAAQNRRQCQSKRATNRTKHRTLEMPHARVC